MSAEQNEPKPVTTQKKSARQLPVLLGLLLAVTLIAYLARPRSQAGQLVPQASRESMAPLVVTQIDGTPWRLADHYGQIVLINYWATWCGPCREELPGLAQLARTYPSKDLAILGISLDRDRAAVQPFADHYRLAYPIAFPGPLSPLSAGMFALPTTLLIDRSGRIARHYTGAVPRAEFQSDIDQLNGEPASRDTPPAQSSYTEIPTRHSK